MNLNDQDCKNDIEASRATKRDKCMECDICSKHTVFERYARAKLLKNS